MVGVDLPHAAERLGVHYQTAYKWVRNGSLTAVKVASGYDVSEAEVERLLRARRTPVAPPAVAVVRDWPAQRRRMHGCIVEGDELGARGVVDRIREGGTEPLVVIDELLAPVLRRVGDEWAAGRLSVAAEHRASAICERLLARLAVHPRGRPRGVAVIATPPGEEHGLPAAMAAVALRADRWQVHHLGAQVPVPDLVDLVSDVGAGLVVLSVTYRAAGPRAEQARAALAPTGATILIGAPEQSLHRLVADARRRTR